jgi:dolichol-phosphate mannosyltransferase
VILLQLLIGGSIMISLGLIGMYIAPHLYRGQGRPRYIIAETTEREDRT